MENLTQEQQEQIQQQALQYVSEFAAQNPGITREELAELYDCEIDRIVIETQAQIRIQEQNEQQDNAQSNVQSCVRLVLDILSYLR